MTTDPLSLLLPTFERRHVAALLRHFSDMTEEFQKGDWEGAIAKSGKFLEAVLKALYVRTGHTPPTGKHFKVDAIITSLAGTPAASADDTIRLTIPRACRFMYDVASNRGGRHDPDEIDPNEMDAHAVVTQASWVLAEMIRHAQHGAATMEEAKATVESLMRRKYPLIEKIDGRTYFHGHKASGTDVALVILFDCYPKRIAADDLVTQVKSNKFSLHNARVAVTRIDRYVDRDKGGKLMLLAPGLVKAEAILRGAVEKAKR
jgi:hypothetical protein